MADRKLSERIRADRPSSIWVDMAEQLERDCMMLDAQPEEPQPVFPGNTLCQCRQPRYERCATTGKWYSRIFRDGKWRLISDGAKRCRGCQQALDGSNQGEKTGKPQKRAS